jgi:AhpD family alkylhydroperoxidase
MQSRMKNPLSLFPEALKALLAYDKATEADGLPAVTKTLVHLRASQINGCGFCTDMHAHELRKLGQSDNRLFGAAAWRDSPHFTEAERAALDLAEHATRLADRMEAVPDAVWAQAAKHYDEKALAALVLQIALINAFNRVAVTTRQIAGRWD